MSEKRFDVIAKRLDDGAERFIAQDENERDADAMVYMCVMRRGVEVEIFFTKERAHQAQEAGK